jgi:TPR repeat protein
MEPNIDFINNKTMDTLSTETQTIEKETKSIGTQTVFEYGEKKQLDFEEIQKHYKINFNNIIEDNLEYRDNIVKIYNSDYIKISDYDLSDVKMLYIIGKYYEKVIKDNDEAKRFYYKGIEKSNVKLIECMGNLLNKEKIYEEAKIYWKMAIDYGSMISCRKLGIYYKDIEKNQEEAIKYLLLAIERGCYDSMLILSIYYYEIDFEKYKDDIEKLNIMCLDKHEVHSSFNLAVFNEKIKNYEMAVKFYKIGVEHGNEKSMLNLAIYYKNKEKNIDLYLKYAKMSVEHGSSRAMHNLGLYYNIIKNYEESKKYYLMAIQLNNSDSMIELGKTYLIVDKDFEQAKKYFLMGIGNNNSNGYYQLGMLYKKYQIDYAESKKYFELGAEKDCVECIYELGKIYHKDNNKSEAKKYFLLGSEKGCGNCAFTLAKDFSDNDFEFIKKYLKIAIKNGSINAFHALAITYLYHDNNHEQAEKYFILGSESNDDKCLESLLKFYSNTKNYTNQEICKKLKKMKPSKIIVNQIKVFEEQNNTPTNK